LILRELKTEQFRNLADKTLVFDERGQIIIGDNGQGKTNLLEAIYYLTIFRSFRSSSDLECIRFQGKHFSLNGKLLNDEGVEETISAGYDGRRKRVVVSGKEARNLSEAFGVLKSVLVSPEDILIVQEGPATRRKYLDIVLSLISPLYLQRLKRYRKALAARNFLLRDQAAGENVIRPWERQMAEYGAFLTGERLFFVERLAPVYGNIFYKLSSGEKGELIYRSAILEECGTISSEKFDVQQAQGIFAGKMGKTRVFERSRGMTMCGPQTDDLSFMMEGRPLKNYGSQGQQRTAVICLRLAEAHILEKLNGIRPVLLLDDIFAELDLRRCFNLLEELVETHQSFLTAPRKEAIFERLGHLPVRKIRQGDLYDS
jgi:DNA replication and repair protein RecF